MLAQFAGRVPHLQLNLNNRWSKSPFCYVLWLASANCPVNFSPVALPVTLTQYLAYYKNEYQMYKKTAYEGKTGPGSKKHPVFVFHSRCRLYIAHKNQNLLCIILSE
jgi:hypothetical protein